MGLFFITGNSGAGKTTLMLHLRSLGYEAYDTDDDGFAKWTHNETGYAHPKSEVTPEVLSADFLKEHTWKVPVDVIKELAQRAKDKTIFLCGFAANEAELRNLFQGTFALVMDDETLKYRVATRTNNVWGKQPHELAKILKDQAGLHKMYDTAGHIIVDATLPLEDVASFILGKVNDLESKPA